MSAEGQAKELKAMRGEELEFAYRQELIAHPDAATSEYLVLRAELLRRLQPQGRECVLKERHPDEYGEPTYVCKTHPAEAESSSAGPVWDESRIKKLVDAVWKADTPQGNFNDSTHTDYCVRAVIEQIVLGEFFPASQQVPQQSVNYIREVVPRPDDPSCHVCGALMSADHWKCGSCGAHTGVEGPAASQQVDVSAIAEEIAKRCVRAQEYAKKTADEPIQGWEFSQIARSVLQKAMGAATPSELDKAVARWLGAKREQVLREDTKGDLQLEVRRQEQDVEEAIFAELDAEEKWEYGTERGAATAQPKVCPTCKRESSIVVACSDSWHLVNSEWVTSERGATPGEPAQVKEKP